SKKAGWFTNLPFFMPFRFFWKVIIITHFSARLDLTIKHKADPAYLRSRLTV
ncbi:MAG: hypothetical protein ACJA0X_002568, partial [Cyclobacteriaceae bacterium]